MGSKPTEPSDFRNLPSPFTKVIATRYYDGPMEGFLAHNEWLQACVFQLVDWDRETDVRTYDIARVEHLSFDDVVGMLFEERRPTWPVWVLPSSLRERGEQLVDQCFKSARPVATVTTRDLFGEISFWDPADDAPLSSGLVMPSRRRDTG
jgi:hypothetical protein